MTDINLRNINKILDGFKKDKAKLEDSIAKIDEKYRRLAEEKKKELVAELAKCAAEVEFWENTVLPRYAGCADEDEPSDSTQEDVVVDDDLPETVEEKVEVEDKEETKDEEQEDEELVVDEDEVPVMEGIPVEDVNIVEKMESSNSEPVQEEEIVEDVPEQAEPKDDAVSASDALDDFWKDEKDNW